MYCSTHKCFKRGDQHGICFIKIKTIVNKVLYVMLGKYYSKYHLRLKLNIVCVIPYFNIYIIFIFYITFYLQKLEVEMNVML